jgi:hypothetical protein
MSDKLKAKAKASGVGPAPLELGLKELPSLTLAQRKCLEVILDFFIQHRYYPTHREILEQMGINGDNADPYVKPLVKKGYLVRVARMQRSIRLTSDACERLQLEGVDVEERLAAARESKPLAV